MKCNLFYCFEMCFAVNLCLKSHNPQPLTSKVPSKMYYTSVHYLQYYIMHISSILFIINIFITYTPKLNYAVFSF